MICVSPYALSFFKKTLFREEGREKGRKTLMCETLADSYMHPSWGPNLQPGYVPWLGFELVTSPFVDDAPPAELYRSGLYALSWLLKLCSKFWNPAAWVFLFFSIILAFLSPLTFPYEFYDQLINYKCSWNSDRDYVESVDQVRGYSQCNNNFVF